MTSLDTGRWIIPKGNIPARLTPAQAAEREAFEEAGLKGAIEDKIPLGIYTYFKMLDGGESRPATVEVYLLRVRRTAKKFPERGERLLAWLSLSDAMRTIQEPGVVPLLLRLAELEDTLIQPKRRDRRPSSAKIGPSR